LFFCFFVFLFFCFLVFGFLGFFFFFFFGFKGCVTFVLLLVLNGRTQSKKTSLPNRFAPYLDILFWGLGFGGRNPRPRPQERSRVPSSQALNPKQIIYLALLPLPLSNWLVCAHSQAKKDQKVSSSTKGYEQKGQKVSTRGFNVWQMAAADSLPLR
jgi:hypothetical protein